MNWALTLWLLAAQAGGDPTAMDQIGPAPLNAPRRPTDSQPVKGPALSPSATSDQISSGRRDVGPAATVGPRSQEARSYQLNTARATPDAPPNPAAQPTRRTTVDRVQGEDHCDPTQPGSPRDVCARVIETRSSEFGAHEPEVTAEERLLSDMGRPEALPSGIDARAAARRLASGDPGDSEAAQALALAGTLEQERAPDKPEDPQIPSDASAAAALILQSILQGVPR